MDLKNLATSLNTHSIKDFVVNFLAPIISLSITSLILLIVFYPSARSLDPLTTEVDQKAKLSQQLEDKIQKLKTLSDYKTSVSENADLVKRVLVDEAQVPQLLTQVDTIARESGITVTKMNYSFSDAKLPAQGGLQADIPVAPSTYKKVNVSFGGFGNYDQVVLFLKNLENSARLIDVDTLRFAVDEKNDFKLDANFGLTSPYLKVESAAITDDPLDLDMSNKSFTDLIAKLKELKYYNIGIDEPVSAVVKEAVETTITVEN